MATDNELVPYAPALVQDRASLDEIYRLRPIAWEYSPDGDIINTTLYPDGWQDSLDEGGIHWAIINDAGQIVSGARLNILHSLEDIFPISDHTTQPLFLSDPFAYISRLVVHPNSRNRGLAHMMDRVRIRYAIQASVESIAVLAGDLGVARFSKYGFIHRLSFLNPAYTVNPRKAQSHLMTLELKSLPANWDSDC